MKIGDLVAAIAKCGRDLQHKNPEMTLEQFHAIEIVVRAEDSRDDHSFAGNLESVSIEESHGDDGELFCAFDCGNEDA